MKQVCLQWLTTSQETEVHCGCRCHLSVYCHIIAECSWSIFLTVTVISVKVQQTIWFNFKSSTILVRRIAHTDDAFCNVQRPNVRQCHVAHTIGQVLLSWSRKVCISQSALSMYMTFLPSCGSLCENGGVASPRAQRAYTYIIYLIDLNHGHANWIDVMI